MLDEIRISNYRCFKKFEIAPLSKVNLFIGSNNAGKTAALEGIELLARGPDPSVILDVLSRRKEYAVDYSEISEQFGYDHRGLFYGRMPRIGDMFEISSSDRKNLTCKLELLGDEEEEHYRAKLFKPDAKMGWSEGPYVEPLGLRMVSEDYSERIEVRLPLTERFQFRGRGDFGRSRVRYLGTSLFDDLIISILWDELALTPREDQTIEVLRIIEPEVLRVAVLGGQSRRNGVYVLLSDGGQRIPLGSMGEGIRRLFAMALAIGNTPRGGVLLIDEIDTGLHHSVMRRMWELVIESAIRYNFQIFATTHSLDCLLALSRIVAERDDYCAQTMVHRLDRFQTHSTVFHGHELSYAIDKELEIR